MGRGKHDVISSLPKIHFLIIWIQKSFCWESSTLSWLRRHQQLLRRHRSERGRCSRQSSCAVPASAAALNERKTYAPPCATTSTTRSNGAPSRRRRPTRKSIVFTGIGCGLVMAPTDEPSSWIKWKFEFQFLRARRENFSGPAQLDSDILPGQGGKPPDFCISLPSTTIEKSPGRQNKSPRSR